MTERWRFVPGYHPYEISSLGRVRRAGRLLNGCLNTDGYRAISTSIKGCRKLVPVHTFVLLAFKGPRPTPKHTAAHGRRGKLVNAVGNLRWATMPEQYCDRLRDGTDCGGEKNWNAFFTRRQVNRIRRVYRRGHSRFGQRPLARHYGVTRTAIYCIVTKRSWA